jgi:hypothetical protein
MQNGFDDLACLTLDRLDHYAVTKHFQHAAPQNKKARTLAGESQTTGGEFCAATCS